MSLASKKTKKSKATASTAPVVRFRMDVDPMDIPQDQSALILEMALKIFEEGNWVGMPSLATIKERLASVMEVLKKA